MRTPEETQSITINGVEYVKKGFAPSQNVNGMPYAIVRTRSAGVFAGYIRSRDRGEVVLMDARRLWYWKGAASLSQLAVDGVSTPEECKFPCEVAIVTLMEVIEILPCTEKAQQSIQGVPVWKV